MGPDVIDDADGVGDAVSHFGMESAVTNDDGNVTVIFHGQQTGRSE